MRDLVRIVLLSSDALQADIQRIQLLQKVKEKCQRRLKFNLHFLSHVGIRTGKILNAWAIFILMR